MPTTYSQVRRVLVALWLIRNSESPALTQTVITRRTGVDHRQTRRVLTMLRRLGLAATHQDGAVTRWQLTPKGITKARSIQDRYEATDNARRAAACR